MLSKQDNELITQTGPGTPMGALFRQYWLPALLSAELPHPDSDPLRVLLLSEQLIAFRDSNGKVGLIQNNCPHRGASLFFGRNEEAGLRCVYHGWKFDAAGNCIDMPNEPAESDFKSKVKAIAYPTIERNGIVWAYLGPRSTPPPLPLLEGNMLPEGGWEVSAVQRECNWLQGLEGDFDTSHASFLHSGKARLAAQPEGTWGYYMQRQPAPKYAVVDTPGGAMYTGYRDAEPGFTYHRIAQFMFPSVTMTPVGVLGVHVRGKIWVPMDDEHSLYFFMLPKIGTAGSRDAAVVQRSGAGNQFAVQDSGWLSRFKLAVNATNDYGLDRAMQRSGEEYTGLRGVQLQDQMITESEGPVYDRSTEHLGTSDIMIIHLRRRMINAAHALQSDGITPPGVDDPEVYAERSGGVVLPSDADWVTATADLRKGFTEHPEIDPVKAGGVAI
jgi:phthalate 4,5-dioxygenase oxygenase subunit